MSEIAPSQLPPHNRDAERGVLGGILRDPDVLPEVQQFMVAEQFYFDAHQKIYQALCDLANETQPIDLVLLHDKLRKNKQLEDVGGVMYLTELWEAVPTGANAQYHAKLVRDTAMVRGLIHASNEILRDSYERTQSADELVSQAERKIMEIAKSGMVGETQVLADVVNAAFTRLDSRVGKENLSISGLATGYVDLDNITAGLQNSELVIIAARPSVGKCLPADAEILLADGRLARIEDLYRARAARLITLGNDWRFAPADASAFVDDGVKPVYRVRTRLGREVETTLSHPFRTYRGWRPLAELSAGDRIAVPRRVPVFGTDSARDCEVKLLAYRTGDRSRMSAKARAEFAELRGDSARHMSPLAEVRSERCAALNFTSFSLAQRPLTRRRSAATLSREGRGQVGSFVPEFVFRLPEAQLAVFLNRLFATDGWATVTREGAGRIGYASTSERLARQLQHLLLRFGVVARLRARQVKYRGTLRPAWQLDLIDPVSVRAFADRIGIFGKEEAVAKARAAAKGTRALRDRIPAEVWADVEAAKGTRSWAEVAERAGLPRDTNLKTGRTVSRSKLRKLATAVNRPDLAALADGDVYWDEIVSIEPLGAKQVYDLTVPGTHNFVASDVCVHNTAFALNMVRNIVTESDPHGNMPVVLFFSLEMARIELAERLLCCQSRVDSHKVRKGHLSSEDIDKLMAAGDILKRARLYIDDTPSRTMIQIAASARRLQKKHERDGGLKLIVIDYLQLIEPENRRDPRQEQVAQISRRLKFLARELLIPVIAIAQVNRASEDRQDHKPRLSDLRESGCLTGDTLITLADTGARVPIRDLMGRSGFRVWALDETTLKLKAAEVSCAFPTGRKPVFRLTTRLGRTIRATANHPFRAFGGWKRLDELAVGERVAVPRALPEGTATCETLSAATHLSSEVRNACVFAERPSPGLEDSATLSPLTRGEGFVARAASLPHARDCFTQNPARVTLAPRQRGEGGGASPPGEGRYTTGGATHDHEFYPNLRDVYWDEVVSIVPDGEEEVYDLTVPGPHNFVADGFVVHNSIEQDADTCMMLHRPGRFDGAQDDNILEIIIAKQRNGPTGEITLTWMKKYNRYENYIADVGMGEGV
jgi:replicative DNA helicase